MAPIVSETIAAEQALLTAGLSAGLAADQFGVDVWSDGRDVRLDFGYVTGLDIVKQRVIRRLQTPRGMLQADPDFGIDLTDFVNTAVTRESVLALRGAVQNEVSKEEAVQEVRVTVDVRTDYTIDISVECVTAAGPFRLVATLPSTGVLEFLYG